jgi:hypothetical protein
MFPISSYGKECNAEHGRKEQIKRGESKRKTVKTDQASTCAQSKGVMRSSTLPLETLNTRSFSPRKTQGPVGKAKEWKKKG